MDARESMWNEWDECYAIKRSFAANKTIGWIISSLLRQHGITNFAVTLYMSGLHGQKQIANYY